MAGQSGGMGNGTKLAIGVLLLWISGGAFFVAFMSGHSPTLTVGTAKDAQGKTVNVGPRNVSDLVSRASATLQALEGGAPAWPPTGPSSSSTAPTDTGPVSA